MKVKKNGWGTTEMIVLICCLFLFLGIAIYFLSDFYGSIEGSVKNKFYFDLEIKLEDAAREYITNEKINVDGSYRISLKKLIDEGYILDLKDQSGDKCNGYVIVSKMDNIINYKGYILCNKYQSPNY